MEPLGSSVCLHWPHLNPQGYKNILAALAEGLLSQPSSVTPRVYTTTQREAGSEAVKHGDPKQPDPSRTV